MNRTLGAGMWMVAVLTVSAYGQSRDVAPPVSPTSMMADQLLLLAQSALDGTGQVRDDQLIRARILLNLATQTQPDDPELWRLRSDLAKLEGDREAQIEALRQYVRRASLDDAAQLELLLLSLANHQTLDQRITSAATMLDGPAGQQLSPAVQSRLASFIASSYHELGNDEAFGKRLAQALRLDSSNIAAARMGYELAVSRQRSPADLAQALLSLVRANPADASTRRRFGEALLEAGLGEQAASQFQATRVLDPQPADLGLYRDWAAALIFAGRLDDANAMFEQLEQVFDRMAKEGPDAGADPMQPGLPVDLQILKLVMLETPEAAAPNEEATAAFNAVYDRLKAQADAGDQDASSRLAILSLICRRRMTESEAYVDAVIGHLGPQDPRSQVLLAWRHFRKGDVEAAKPLLAEAAAKDPYGSYLVVLLGDLQDKRRQAVLRQVAYQSPSSLVGLLSARTLQRAGGEMSPDRGVERIAAQMERWPGYLRVPNMAVQPWLTLQLTLEPQRFGYLEPVPLKITLRNRTDLPLSIGDPTGINALPRRMVVLLSLRQTAPGDTNLPTIAPIVVDLGRRIRIEPQQAIDVTTRLDRSRLGILLAGLPNQTVTFSVVGLFDAKPGVDPAQGQLGLLGAMDKVSLAQVAGESITAQAVDTWLASLDEPESVGRFRSLARLTLIAHRLPQEGEAETIATRIAERLSQDLEQLPSRELAWIARFSGYNDLSKRRLSKVHDAILASEDPLVRIVYVATHADGPDAPELVEAMRVRDPDVISFARALQAGLRHEAGSSKDSDADTGQP